MNYAPEVQMLAWSKFHICLRWRYLVLYIGLYAVVSVLEECQKEEVTRCKT